MADAAINSREPILLSIERGCKAWPSGVVRSIGDFFEIASESERSGSERTRDTVVHAEVTRSSTDGSRLLINKSSVVSLRFADNARLA